MAFNDPRAPARARLLHPMTGRKDTLSIRMSECLRFCLHAGITHLESVPVEHCYEAFGVVLKHVSGWKLVYSGDTRPSMGLIEAGMDATILIHEACFRAAQTPTLAPTLCVPQATFESDLLPHAQRKKHSTVLEALEVGQKMRAYRLLLTHFSQRYSKAPSYSTLICSLPVSLFLLNVRRSLTSKTAIL